jgi:hypothetical protein
MAGRKQDKRRPASQKKIRRPAATRAALSHLPPTQLQSFALSTTSEIERLQAFIKQSQATIADLKQVQSLIARLDAQRTPLRDAAARLPHAEAAAEILATVGHPMQLKDLLAAMAARGAVVAGKSDRQRRSNLIITLGRSTLVRRVGHGLYALTESRASA